jgi:predicted O-methyltransferase YrrM
MLDSLNMTPLEIVLLGVLAVVLVQTGRRLRRESLERRRRRNADRGGTVPIPKISIIDVDEAFSVGLRGPDRDRTEVTMLGGGGLLAPGSTTDFEAWILAVLAKRAHRMFEFGTCTGRTAYLWARNSPPEATVTTLTLGPEQQALYEASEGDRAADTDIALSESNFKSFLYSGTDVAYKVEQLFGDSKAFDEAPYAGQMDLIFVDGSHAYSYVISDSQKALRMIRSGGLVLWHDYDGPMVDRGTNEALVELAREFSLSHIEQTRMVVYRAP